MFPWREIHLMEWGIDEDNIFEFDWYDESNVSDNYSLHSPLLVISVEEGNR